MKKLGGVRCAFAVAGSLVAGLAWMPAAVAQERRLTAGDGAAGDEFGHSVVVEGTTAVVGAPFADDGRGAAYVFTQVGDEWTQTAKLTASGAVAGDNLGWSVAVTQTRIVVGAPGAAGSGAVYTFARATPATWTQAAMLTASDGAAGDILGWSVDADGETETVVAGAVGAAVGGNADQGAVYTFDLFDRGMRSETAKLTASDGAASDSLGGSVAIEEDTIVAGAPEADVGADVDQGAVYTFAATGAAARTETAKLTASDGAAADLLGASVAIDSAIVAGAPQADVASRFDPSVVKADQGAVYEFALTGAAAREQTEKLLAAAGAAGDRFGHSVAIWGSAMVIGAPFEDVGASADQGAIYGFGAFGGGQAVHLGAAGGAAGERFGSSVALVSTIIVGAPRTAVGGNAHQGSAVVDPADPPTEPSPPPTPTPASPTVPPAEPATSPPPPDAVMRLRVPRPSVFGDAGSRARCRMRSGLIRACRVRLLAGGRVLAEGSTSRDGAGRRRLTVTLELTGHGRALLERRLGGVRARVRARGITSGGTRRVTARTRALLRREHFTTPAGAWMPERAILTARGRSFVRSLRGKLIAVVGIRCVGHDANVRGSTVTTSRLSSTRAAVMCDALGVAASQRLAGRGDSEAIASNATAAGRAKNRRVEVTVKHRPGRL